MTEDPSDGIREFVHTLWANVAPQWDQHADEVDARGQGQTERLLALAEVGPGDRVLELACGPGGVGLAAASVVGPEGEVVLSDVAESMAAVAAARATARGLTNVTTAVRDLEAIDEPDASFDVVLSREGLMFAVDPARAAGEVHRVLRSGGRAALSVWGPSAANPWLSELMAAVSTELGVEMPPPGVPGPFTLAEADLEGLLADAGFEEVVVEDVPVPQRLSGFDEYWQLTPDLAGPLAAVLAGLEEAQRSAIQDRLQSALAPYETAGGLDIPGVSRIVSGRRP